MTQETAATPAKLCKLEIDGAFTQRGFWLYIWTGYKGGRAYHYVGRTGDNAFPTALSPIHRIATHITTPEGKGVFNRARRLRDGEVENLRLVDFDRFEVTSYGPILPEAEGSGRTPERIQAHREHRDQVAPLERRLCEAMNAMCADDGHRTGVVINTVGCKLLADEGLWRQVHASFVQQFPNLPEDV